MSETGPQRGSDAHSPRLDDQLAHEVDALVHGAPDEGRTEGRRHEDIAVDGVGEGLQRSDLEPAAPGLGEAELDLRAQVAAYLAPAHFPADAPALRAVAADEHAPEAVLAILDALPAGRTYEVLSQVWEDAGGAVEHRDGGSA